MTASGVAQLAIIALVAGLGLIVLVVIIAEKRRERIRSEWVSDRVFDEPQGDRPNLPGGLKVFHSAFNSQERQHGRD